MQLWKTWNGYWRQSEKMNYFVEGLQGAGKTTLVQQLSEMLEDYKVFREGDYSPVELAWCAYVTKEQYRKVWNEYPSLHAKLREKTVTEGDHRVICYTQILTDVPDFHRNLERFEIYNGNLGREPFEQLILDRFGSWNGEGGIFECSVFQNIMENQMLYLMMTDDEIMDFYRRLNRVLADRSYKILYLDVEDIGSGIEVIRRERSDEEGNELWFPLMLRYIEESPYGRSHGLKGLNGLLKHLERRRALEHRIIDEVFRENTVVLKSKGYTREDLEAYVI